MVSGSSSACSRSRSQGLRILAVLPYHYPRALIRAHGFHPMGVWAPPSASPDSGNVHFQAYACSIVTRGAAFLLEDGFADELLPSDQVEQKAGKASASAVRRMEAALRASGMPKSEAMRLISEFKASAGDPAGNGEGDPTERGHPVALSDTAALAASLTTILKR